MPFWLVGMGDYIGSAFKLFRLLPASLEGADVSGVTNKTYTGATVTQAPAVKVGGIILKPGTDYIIAYKNNKNTGTETI